MLRAIEKQPDGLVAFLAECEAAHGADQRLDAHLTRVRKLAAKQAGEPDPVSAQFGARRLVEELALALQASLLVRHSPAVVADAFCAARLGGEAGRVYGTLPAGVDAKAIIDRAHPV